MSLHYLLWILIRVILRHIIPSLIDYIIIVLILTVLPGPYSWSTTFRRWAKLTSIFLILSFHLEQQTWIRACVIYVVSIAFASSFLLLDVVVARWHLHRTSRQNLSWSPSIYYLVLIYQSNSWGEIPSLPVNDSCCDRHHPWLPTNTELVMFWLYLTFLDILGIVPLYFLWPSDSILLETPC